MFEHDSVDFFFSPNREIKKDNGHCKKETYNCHRRSFSLVFFMIFSLRPDKSSGRLHYDDQKYRTILSSHWHATKISAGFCDRAEYTSVGCIVPMGTIVPTAGGLGSFFGARFSKNPLSTRPGIPEIFFYLWKFSPIILRFLTVLILTMCWAFTVYLFTRCVDNIKTWGVLCSYGVIKNIVFIMYLQCLLFPVLLLSLLTYH